MSGTSIAELARLQGQGKRSTKFFRSEAVGRGVSRALFFAKYFFRNPVMQGSIVPSSSYLVNRLLRRVDWERARVLVELGPGIGTVTQEILRRMHPAATLVAIELNEDYARLLADQIRDSRFRAIHGSAVDVRRMITGLGFTQVDYIISSLPYTNMGDSARRLVMQASREALAPDGTLLVFQYTTTVLPYLKCHFRSVERDFQLLNIPPALIFHCQP